eukprot:SAG31_NODE_197_length_20660_cov_8.861368_11_plen_178_part_00
MLLTTCEETQASIHTSTALHSLCLSLKVFCTRAVGEWRPTGLWTNRNYFNLSTTAHLQPPPGRSASHRLHTASQRRRDVPIPTHYSQRQAAVELCRTIWHLAVFNKHIVGSIDASMASTTSRNTVISDVYRFHISRGKYSREEHRLIDIALELRVCLCSIGLVVARSPRAVAPRSDQ